MTNLRPYIPPKTGSVVSLASVVAGLLLFCTPVIAQISPGSPHSGALQMYTQNWSIEDGDRSYSLRQTTIPVGIYIPLADGAEANITTSYVSMSRTDSVQTGFNGLSDLKIQTNFSPRRSRNLVFGFALNLPTGYRDLTNEEHKVLIDFVGPDLSVRQNRLGEGLNIGATVSYAKRVSDAIVLGGALGFVQRGSFDTFELDGEESISLKPGYQATATMVLNWFGTDSQVRISPSLTTYGTEFIDNVEFFRLGPKIQLQALYTRNLSFGRATISAQEVYRLPNKQRLRNPDGTGEELRVLDDITNTSYFALFGALDVRLHRKASVTISNLGKVLGPENENNVYGHSRIYEGGLSLQFQPSSQMRVGLGFRYVSGSGVGWRRFNRNIRGSEGFLRASYQIL